MFHIHNILSLVDLSEHSDNVLNASLQLMRRFNAGLKVYHASPNLLGESQVKNIKESIENKLSELGFNAQKDEVQIFVANEDFPGGALLNQLITDVDLAVLGCATRPNGKGRKAKIVDVVDEAMIPVLAIPKEQAVNDITNILYCSSYQDLESTEPLEVLKCFAKEYDSEVRVAHVKTHSGKPNEDSVEQSRLEGAFFEPDVRYSYKLIRSPDVIDGIQHYIRRKGDNDLCVMIRRKHHIFERIFGKNFTFRMLQETEIPLLILKEPQLN